MQLMVIFFNFKIKISMCSYVLNLVMCYFIRYLMFDLIRVVIVLNIFINDVY